MRKLYLSAPLPFVGQKRMFAKEFIKVLDRFSDGTTFVDLFGGSGLLSHITKCRKPNSTVVYNDFDNYRKRIENIPVTNALLSDLRKIVRDVPRKKRITGETREKVLACLKRYLQQYGYVDFITISSSILFSMKYVTIFEDVGKETLYNNIRMNDYPPCSDYLDGLQVVCCDYKNLYDKYKDMPKVVFLIDPPYLNTEVGTYNMYWKLPDYLDVLKILQGCSFVYFTSDKSSIIELCEWMEKNKETGNPFKNCSIASVNAHVNHNAGYTDMMLYTV